MLRALGTAVRITGRLLRALLALALLAGLLGGLPYLLVTWIGWPLPAHMPTLDEASAALTTPISDGRLMNLLALVAWIVWALFLRDVTVEAIEAAIAVSEARYGRPRAPRPTRDPLRLAATVLIGAVVGAVLLGPLRGTAGTRGPGGVDAAHAATHPPTTTALVAPRHGGAAAQAAQRPAATGPAAATHPPARPAITRIPTSIPATPTTVAATTGTATSADVPGWALRAAGGTYTVREGDNLWDIAHTHLGDPHRWREIYVLNRHRPQRNGYALTDPDQIHIGWTLALPSGPTAPPSEPSPPPSADNPPPSSGEQVPPNTSEPTPDRAEEPAASTSPAPTPTAGTHPGDDGVVGAPPAQVPPAPSPTSISPSPSGTAGHPAPEPDRTAPPGPPGITLTGNSWVDLGLATAITSAAALVWAHRRRRYRPRPPTPELRLDDPDMAPLPAVVNQIRRLLRHRTEAAATDPDAAQEARPTAVAHAIPGVDTAEQADVGAADTPAARPTPVAPAVAGPLAPLWPPAGLGLTGPGAEAAARGFLTATLATGTPEDIDTPGEVVIPAVTLATLLGAGAVDVGDLPRLTVTDGLPEALDVLEEQTLYRSRLVYTYEADNVETLRRIAPHEDPLPPFVLIADATAAHERARIAALLTQGQRLDLHGILLGPWADGDTVTVAHDGTTSPAGGDTARHGAHPADIGRLTVLTPDETGDLLRTLAEAHTGQRQAGQPHSAAPARQAAGPGSTESGARSDGDGEAATTGPTEPGDTTAPRTRITLRDVESAAAHQHPTPAARSGEATTEPNRPPRSEPVAPPPGPPAEPDAAENPTRPSATADPTGFKQPEHPPTSAASRIRARVHVLGSPRILGYTPPPGQSLRKKSLELLVYLAVHKGSASIEAIIDDVLPGARAKTVDRQLHTNVYGLRRALKAAAGDAHHVTLAANRYALDPDLVEVDLWIMGTAIADARSASEKPARIAALRRAVEQYHGALAQDCQYEWVEPYRETARQQALDTHRALAQELTTDDPAEAIAVLDAAIAHSPYADVLYQEAMRLHHRLGDIDGIRARHHAVTLRLREIDVDPADDTEQLAAQLIADLQTRAARRSSGYGQKE